MSDKRKPKKTKLRPKNRAILFIEYEEWNAAIRQKIIKSANDPHRHPQPKQPILQPNAEKRVGSIGLLGLKYSGSPFFCDNPYLWCCNWFRNPSSVGEYVQKIPGAYWFNFKARCHFAGCRWITGMRYEIEHWASVRRHVFMLKLRIFLLKLDILCGEVSNLAFKHLSNIVIHNMRGDDES